MSLKQEIRNKYKHTSSFWTGISLMLADAIAIMLAIGIGFFIINEINHSWIDFKSFIKYSIFLPFILILFYANGLYPGITLAPESEIKTFAVCIFFSFCSEGAALSTIKATRDLIPIILALAIAWPSATILLPFTREFSRRMACRLPGWGVPAIIYSKGNESNVITDRLISKPHLGYKPVLIITDEPVKNTSYNGIPVRNNNEEIGQILKELKIKVAIICGYDKNLEEIQTAYRYMIRVPKNQMQTTMSLQMKNFGGIMGFSSTNNLTKRSALALKRTIDLFACIIASPLFILATLIIASAIKITSPGPVFYGHKRVGKNRKEFKCWKFRSMCIDADKKLAEILANDPVRAAQWEKERKFEDDPRVTKLGKFLRKTSLDELPQLINVFTGEMSLTGPRPVTKPELTKYGNYADYVLSVKPGLSGMWQVSGRSDTSYEDRVNLDTYYIQNWSVWLDIWILVKTVWIVINGRGAY